MPSAAKSANAQSNKRDIAVESTPGEGTTVSVLLPRVNQPGEAQTPVRKAAARGSERILLIDDEEPIVKSLQVQLAALGYQVRAEQDARRAFTEFKKNPDGFDLVITDQTMPHMTGCDLSREILGIRPLMPIILCAGFSETVDESSAKAAGIRGFVMKPVGLQEMSEAIRSVLGPS